MKQAYGCVVGVAVWLLSGSVAWAACANDADGDGVCDDLDLCPGTVPGALVDAQGCPPDIFGDGDRDGDLDGADFQMLTDCMFGPDIPLVGVCEAFDLNADLDLDMDEVIVFQRCFSGTGNPADPACASYTARINGNCLYVVGTAADSNLALRLQAGQPALLQIDAGDDGVADFVVSRALITCIIVDAGGGHDLVRIDETNGIFTDTEITQIYGGGGDDVLFGGSGGETFVGGDGDDTAIMGGGSDVFIWGPGDDFDIVEGGTGVDHVEINGSDDTEQFTITANGTRVRVDRISPAPFFVDMGAVEHLQFNARGGDDFLSCTGNLAALIQITADGGPGDDTLLGSNGADLLIGGDDDDFIDGQQGNDLALLGAGNDTFQWDPGDGSDSIEGQTGHDTLVFNGSGASEQIGLFSNGGRLLLFRNVGNVTMDANDLEQVDLRTLGGNDTVTIHDLAGTDVTSVNVDLAGTLGGNSGDGLADTVTVNGTAASDTMAVTAAGGVISVTGLSASVTIAHAEVVRDLLTINGLGGLDSVSVGAGVTTLIMLVINQ